MVGRFWKEVLLERSGRISESIKLQNFAQGPLTIKQFKNCTFCINLKLFMPA